MQIYRTSWGLVGPGAEWATLSAFIRATVGQGYAGVEFALANLDFEDAVPDRAIEKVRGALSDCGLDVIALIATRPEHWGDVEGHMQEFCRQLDMAVALGARKAAVHCGADSFGLTTAQHFLQEVMDRSADTGVTPCIETHRGRILNDPWKTAHLMEALPTMQLTSDLSHWHVVIDREPLDVMEIFDEASRRSGHVHARVGHEKGAQVPHPADPVWAGHLAHYKRWWGLSRDAATERGEPFTVVPEFGPPPYMNTRPFSGDRDANLLELNRWMRDQLVDWFGV